MIGPLRCSLAAAVAVICCVATKTWADTVERPTVSFFLEAGGTYTTNAFVAQEDEKYDKFFASKYGLKIAGKSPSVTMGALTYEISVFTNNARYDEFGVLSGDTVGSSLNLTYQIGQWSFGFDYGPGWSYSQGFNDFAIALHDLSLGAAYTFRSGAFSIVPAASVARRFSSNELAERVSVGGRIAFGYKFSDGASLVIAPSASYAWFDEFPTAQREDATYGISMALNFRASDMLTLGLGATYLTRDSSIAGLDFNVLNAGPKVTINYKF